MTLKGVPKVGLIPRGDPKRGSLKGVPKEGVTLKDVLKGGP